MNTQQRLYLWSCIPCKLDFFFLRSSLEQQDKHYINTPLSPNRSSSSHSTLVEGLMRGKRGSHREGCCHCWWSQFSSVWQSADPLSIAGTEGKREHRIPFDNCLKQKDTHSHRLSPTVLQAVRWTKRAFLHANHLSWHATSCKTAHGALYQKRRRASPRQGRWENATLFSPFTPMDRMRLVKLSSHVR